jgi:hypothetical protein
MYLSGSHPSVRVIEPAPAPVQSVPFSQMDEPTPAPVVAPTPPPVDVDKMRNEALDKLRANSVYSEYMPKPVVNPNPPPKVNPSGNLLFPLVLAGGLVLLVMS